MSTNIKVEIEEEDADVIETIIEHDEDSNPISEVRASRKSYSQKYYENNKEKAKAACREYSAKLRADPVKRELINAQKREMMRRLAERRRIEKGLPPRVRDPDRTRKNHRKYYAENIEKMRECNRRYSAKVRADPEKRAAINEKKKLCMRRLKERRSREANSLDYDTADGSIVMSIKQGEGDDSQAEFDELVMAASNAVVDHQDYIIEEVIYNDGAGEIRDDESQEVEITPVEEYIEEPPEPAETFENVFPETVNVLLTLPEEGRNHFIVYMERCARNYLP